MPSLQTWQEAVSPEDLYFNSTVIELRNHHYPPGGLNISNLPNTTKGMGEMTIAAERWYPVGVAMLSFSIHRALTVARCPTKPIALQTFQLGATRPKSSKLTSTALRSSSTAGAVASRIVNLARYTGNSRISGKRPVGLASNTMVSLPHSFHL